MEAAQGAERTNLKGPEYHEGPGGELGGEAGAGKGRLSQGPDEGDRAQDGAGRVSATQR